MNPLESIIDFTEIETATDFEIFTCDLLECMGYEIDFRPGEGPDGGRDMVVVETRPGRFSDTKVRYLVSCKHNPSGDGVGTGMERDVPGRVFKHHCDAFLGVYSTHPTQQLVKDFDGYKTNPYLSKAFGAEILDGHGIKKQLFELDSGPRLVRQYFPKARLAYLRLQTESNIYRERPVFCCKVCDLNILDNIQGTIVIEAAYGPATQPSGDYERDARHRMHVSAINAFCLDHSPASTRDLPAGSSVHAINDLVEPTAFIQLLDSGLKGMYFWPPHFSNETAFIRWFRLINGLFYFVARGRDPLPPLKDVDALLSPHFDKAWKL